MRLVSAILAVAFAMVMLGHAHCLVEICPGDVHVAAMGVTDAPAEDPLCETETVCPAKDDFRRMDSLALPSISAYAGMELAVVASTCVSKVSVGRGYGLAAITHQPPILTLNQIFRI